MAQKYDRKILSDQLADLGQELGRPPLPRDLKKGMADKKTFMRWFDNNWLLALEYAGFTGEELEPVAAILAETSKKPATKSATTESQEPPPEQSPPAPDGQTLSDPPIGEAKQTIYPFRTANERTRVSKFAARPADWQQDNAKIINLYNPTVFLVGLDGREIRLNAPYQGKAKAVICPIKHAFAEKALANYLAGAQITLSEKAEKLVVLQPGESGESVASFPKYQRGVYYLVSRAVAYAALDTGRETHDLIYPMSYKRQGNSVVIRQLEMINMPKTWWYNPED